MKNKRILVLSLLLCLYIGPLIFVPSFHHTGIAVEQNMSKEFSSSEYLDLSDDSIPSFNETLSDDILFYPDGLEIDRDNTPSFGGEYYTEGSDTASGNYFYSELDDTDDEDGAIETGITASDGLGEFIVHMSITVTDINIAGSDEIYLSVDLWTGVVTGSSEEAYNEEITETGTHEIMHTSSLTEIESFVVWVIYDGQYSSYINLTIDSYSVECMSLVDEDHYGESFADISDWTYISGEVLTSDTDLGIKPHDGDAQYRYDWADTPSLPVGCYLETRYRVNVSGNAGYRIRLFDEDAVGGNNVRIFNYAPLETWQTKRVYCTQAIESIRIGFAINVVSQLEIDYIRIAPADEMGWQHDCSTTTGTDAISSTGDLINVTSSITFDIDTTTTSTCIETEYYPFLDILSNDGSGTLLVEITEDGSSWETVIESTSISSTTYYRANTYETDIDIKQIRVNVSGWVTIDHVRLYSIANYSLTFGTSNTITDVLYCSSGALFASITSATNHYFILDHDPSLSVDTSIYNYYRLNMTTNTQWFAEYVSSWQSWKVDTLTGELTDGTMTDFKILLDGSTTCYNIDFFDNRHWQEVTSITIYFVLPFGYFAINILLILAGIFLIVISSCIAAVKIRNRDISRDALILVLLLFFIGWALFLGGAWFD